MWSFFNKDTITLVGALRGVDGPHDSDSSESFDGEDEMPSEQPSGIMYSAPPLYGVIVYEQLRSDVHEGLVTQVAAVSQSCARDIPGSGLARLGWLAWNIIALKYKCNL